MFHPSFLPDRAGVAAKLRLCRDSRRWCYATGPAFSSGPMFFGHGHHSPPTKGEVTRATLAMLERHAPVFDRLPTLPGLDIDPDSVSFDDLCWDV